MSLTAGFARSAASSYGSLAGSYMSGAQLLKSNDEYRSTSPSSYTMQEPDPDWAGTGKVGFWTSVFNVVNIYVGLGLLSQSFALRCGGWVSLPAMFVLSILVAYTGHCIVRCFAAMDVEKYSDFGGATWANLAHSLLGPAGRWLVMGLAMCEFFGTACIGLVILWEDLNVVLHWDTPERYSTGLVVVATAFVACPGLFMVRYFGRLAMLSILGAASSVLVVLYPVALYAADRLTDAAPVHTETTVVREYTLPLALGIMMLAFSAHACLPSIHNSIQQPADFPRVLHVSFFIMFLVYGLASGFGYLLYGENTYPVLTASRLDGAPEWQTVVNKVVAGFVICQAYTTVVPILGVLAECPQVLLGINSTWSLFAFRFASCILVALTAYAVRDYIGHFQAIVGGTCSLCVTLILPLYLHLLCFQHQMSKLVRALHYLGLVLLFAVPELIIGCTVYALQTGSVST